MAALIVIFIAMAALAGAIVTSVTSISMGKERQAAALLLNRSMEQARAMPFQTLAAGIPNTDTTLATDTHLTQTGTSGGYPVYSYNGETLRTYTPTSSAPTLAPLSPKHVNAFTLNKLTYTVSVYPTVSSTNSSVVHLSILITWSSIAQHGLAKTLTGQTFVYSPTGCLSNGTHPFAAPCQPYFYATGTTGQGSSISVVPQTAGGQIFAGSSASSASLTLPVADMDMQLEQIYRVLGLTTSSGAGLAPGSPATTGLVQASSQTDSDPTTSAPSDNSALLTSPQSVSPLSASGSAGDTLLMTPSGSDTGGTWSTVAAGSVSGCYDLASALQMNGQPCAYGKQQAGAAATAQLLLNAGSSNLGGYIPLASVGAAPSASAVFGTRVTTATGATYCTGTGTSGDGCIHAAESRALGTIQVGGLPPQVISDGVAPSGWAAGNYLFRLTNYSDSLSAENGVGAAAPTATESGTFSYYGTNGNGNCSYKTINLGSSAQTPSVCPVSVSDPNVAGTSLTVTESVVGLTVGGTTTTAASGSCSGTAGCVASASAKALSGTVDYTVQWNGVILAQFAVVLSLSSSSVNATYKAAPSAG